METHVSRRVTIIILAWNRWQLTERCLSTLRRHTDLRKVEVIVVDNGSVDETSARLAGYPWVRMIRNPTNLGFVRGNNVAIAASDPGSDVILLKKDVEIISDGWVDELARCAHAERDIGVVGCRMLLPDGRLLHAGTYVMSDSCWGQQIGSNESDTNQYTGTRDVEGIVFACAYLKRETLAAIGPLSEEYHSYFEDTDYCLRAARAGLRTVLCGAVTVIHHEHGSTSDTPEVFTRLFGQSHQTFRRRWQADLEARYTSSVAWQSIMNFPAGYATSCRQILRALDGEGVRASYSYVYGLGSPFPLPEPPSSGEYLLDVIAGREQPARPPISVVYGQGDVFWRNRGDYRIGYTMLEVDGFPAEWVRQANEMDEVWVPSAFNREAFIRCGVKKPVHVMQLGVDPHHFHPGVKAIPNPRGDYVFVACFEWGERRQPELLLKTFNETFSANEPVMLVCKVINRTHALNIRRRIELLRLKPWGGRIGFIFNKNVPYHELAMLYRSGDCFLSVGRGEGWDMPLMEAMACGLPSIATDWGGHTEFVHDGISYPVRVRGTIPAEALCPYYDGFRWADPDPEHFSALLRHVYEHRAEAAEKGRRAAAEVATRWTWKQAAQRIKARLAAIA